jgi:hypothetical protein
MNNRRTHWQRVLDAEVRRWSALSSEQLIEQLKQLQVYEVKLGSKTYQVEVDLLENTETHLHIMVAVDDGSLPASLKPAVHTFICEKAHR